MPAVFLRFEPPDTPLRTSERAVPKDWSTPMSTYVVPAAGYVLSEEGHAQLCRLTEHLWLLAELAKGYTPPADSPSSPIEGFHWGAGLETIADGLDDLLGGLQRQGEGLG